MHKKREKNLVLSIARIELQRDRRNNLFQYAFLTISIITSLMFILFFFLDVLTITGYQTSIESRGGYITSLVLHSSTQTTKWAGVYGLALRVSGFTELIDEDLINGEIDRVDVFFDCIESTGAEIYIANTSTLDLASSTVVPGTVEMIDLWINCTGDVDCANETFTDTMNVSLGAQVISGIPSTGTYRFDGNQSIFDLGVLNVSGQLVFVTHVSSVQKGYSNQVTVNYQAILPIPPNDTQIYYFYADPNDECPAGGLGTSLVANVHGYIKDITGAIIPDAVVRVAGVSNLSDSNGFYNLSVSVIEGTYNIIVTKAGYYPSFDNFTVNFTNTVIHKNITLNETQPVGAEGAIAVHITGYVTDSSSGLAMSGVNVSFGNDTNISDTDGFYELFPTVVLGRQPIIAYKVSYDNYYDYISVNSSITEYMHNISMDASTDGVFETGPDPDEGFSTKTKDKDKDADFEEEAEKAGQDYWIAPNKIKRTIRKGTFIEEEVTIYNFKTSTAQMVFTLTEDLEDFIELDKSVLGVTSESSGAVTLTIFGTKPVGVYTGSLLIKGDIEQEVPIEITIIDKKLPIETLLMELDLFNRIVRPGGDLRYRLELQNLLSDQSYIVELDHTVTEVNSTDPLVIDTEEFEIEKSETILKQLKIPENATDGEYNLKVNARYFNLISSVSVPFIVARPFYLYTFFGIPLWMIFIFIAFLSFILFDLFLYKRHVEKKKRYHLKVEVNTLPKPGDRSIRIGKLAETNIDAYIELDALTTHGIVAGATGGGKSITAQVIIEEALMKNIAVLVFDPTAQWSGMLRKGEDKKMIALLPKFGLKPTEVRAFPGNVRLVTDYRQSIEIEKYVNPGQIQIFTMNKLQPREIDIFVAGVIANIFRSDPKEHPGLRVLLVFDEVHRLLPKFGGSGKGFLQIERACREFRKWGYGVLLVSQVLSDFVGEIKANINTEILMRAAEENDLKRIKERYGEESLKSLVKAEVGTGMIQNAEYNRGKPYFVQFRPILHNTRRLSDEVLTKYNEYGEIVEDLNYQIEQLEEEKVDVFDLKMELKLVKDKLMTGNFTVVDIYLEGLKPRIEKQWESLGKKPKKKKVELIDVSEVEESVKSAEKDRDKWEKEQKKEDKEEKTEAPKEDKTTKIVEALTFDNGVMVSSVRELQDALPTFDKEMFSVHVNDKKNDIADWLTKQIDPKLGESIKSIRDPQELNKAITEFFKKEKSAKKEEKPKTKEEPKKEEKK